MPILADDGGRAQRAECRTCGYADTWTIGQPERRRPVTEPAVKTTRAERLTMPLARQVVTELAVEHGACIRPVQLRRTDLDTGEMRPGAHPVRAHPGPRLPGLRRTGQDPARAPSAGKAGTSRTNPT